MTPYDLCIVGAGPAGSSLAIRMAGRGHRVLLCERAEFPRGKLCGEFLSPDALGDLARLGLEEVVWEGGASRIETVRFAIGRRSIGPHRLERAGAGMSRRTLDTLLARRAETCGATLLTRCRVRRIAPREAAGPGGGVSITGTLGGNPWSAAARALINATGRGDATLLSPDERSDEPARTRRAAFVAFERHYAPDGGPSSPSPDRSVEMFPFAGGYLGMNPVEGGRINLCFLVSRDQLGRSAGRPEALLRDVAARTPDLARRLERLHPLEPRFTGTSGIFFYAGDLPRTSSLYNRKGRPAVLLAIGDAAGRIPPVCGNGISMALRSAALAEPFVEDLLAGRSTAAETARRYGTAWRREFRPRLARGRALHRLVVGRRTAPALLCAARLVPGLVDRLYRGTRGWGPAS